MLTDTEEKLLNDFIDEVTSSGVEGILPKNLENKWFEPILESSIEFLRIVANEIKTDAEDFLNHEKGMLLLAAVTELLQYRYDYPAHFQIYSVPKEDLYDSLSCYAIAVLMEDGKRNAGLEFRDITEDEILEKDIVTEIESRNPELSEYLYMKISG